MMEKVKLTKYSHGAGCGCKIAPKVLDEILSGQSPMPKDPNLLVGNDKRDDAAVYALDNETAIISTTDFFMPIVDDPFDFGAIAATNAISDIYAMGGKPLLAISILGWPVEKLPPSVAGEVVAGARSACEKASISLAGGHSIDTQEPIFGLAVTGVASRNLIKTNDKAKVGSLLFLTKPLGIGILTTAQKRGLLADSDLETAKMLMLKMNSIGYELAQTSAVTALTDVTGFGLLGHLIEICQGSGVSATISFNKVPLIQGIHKYLENQCIPGGTNRNFASYGHLVSQVGMEQRAILCDPQTSGGLLVAVDAAEVEPVLEIFRRHHMELQAFGKIVPPASHVVEVV
jgi:selenide,water dikinase